MSVENLPTLEATGPVIIVDDDPAVLRSLKFALEIEGLDVRIYGDAQSLLFDDNLPARGCLLIDYAMAGMDGFELVERLRRRNVRLPAILMTGLLSREVRERARRAGFCKVLEKPLHDGALLDGIRSALTRSQERPQ
ncbi:response regulator [Bosea sp. (in: a-proteobacteria)]|uniref:response regulator transcription factor n=1 Tax=Bosea sp. (in: a-proteobacteria) TaxID=1871050 RepID=UPI0025BFEFA9|nr:response regulator [Bosea sp. (in: a-proteobacteria)]MBR3194350.1 response regulator [Bosea sp. (in: a-proteobacteria)]